MPSLIKYVLIHVICDDKEIENSFFTLNSRDIMVNQISTVAKYYDFNTDKDKFAKVYSVATQKSSNIKLLVDYKNPHNAFNYSTDSMVFCLQD